MISEQAMISLDRLFRTSVSRHIQAYSAQACELEPITDETSMDEQEFALITLSSPVFKALGIFHFSHDEGARYWFQRLSSTPRDTFGETEYKDAFLEFCNMCWGRLNRELLACFPHLGMSTPYFLMRDSLPFMQDLNPGFSRHYRVRIFHVQSPGPLGFGRDETDVILHISLHVCDFGRVDFTARNADTIEDTGELELF